MNVKCGLQEDRKLSMPSLSSSEKLGIDQHIKQKPAPSELRPHNNHDLCVSASLRPLRNPMLCFDLWVMARA